jgi:hypothetical protein
MTRRIGKVISGGQTGADTAGLKAAAAAAIPTGGTAPKGYRTECGSNPALEAYGLREHASWKYPPRTAQNVADADATLILAANLDAGSALTWDICRRMGKPVFHLAPADFGDPRSLPEATDWLVRVHDAKGGPLTLNIAGNRESQSPGIAHAAEVFLAELFRRLND